MIDAFENVFIKLVQCIFGMRESLEQQKVLLDLVAVLQESCDKMILKVGNVS